MTEIQSLTLKLGEAMDKFVLAKLAKDRANLEFQRLQRDVTQIEEELRDIKWSQLTV